jgi:type II secretory pathway pseudopilin PulG
VEVLIVVLIMAVISARVVAQYSMSNEDAVMSSMHFSEDQMTRAVARYRVEHRGNIPTVGSSTPAQLTSKTNADGVIGTSSLYRYGPYLLSISKNPVSGVATVSATNSLTPNIAGFRGWIFLNKTGQVLGGTKKTASWGGGY